MGRCLSRVLPNAARRNVGGRNMSSAFTWLDHSDSERRNVLEAIDRFKETDTRDELGIAPIRDGFADLFFPGTGVLMTRARYFLFVPWMYLELERRGYRDDIATRGRRAEVQLIETLGDEIGTIGKLAKGTLKRFPSSIYWLGLSAAWGIRTFDGTHADYHRFIESGANRAEREARDDDGEPVGEGSRRSWHAGLPRAPEEFPKRATLDLTRSEAAYLRERIRLNAPGTMLALLLRSGPIPDVAYPWMHPRFADLPQDLRDALTHAQCFAEAMHGAAMLYNLMLAEADERDSVGEFRDRLTAWSEELQGRERELRAWKVADFWLLARKQANVPPSTFAFINHWLELRTWETPSRACDDKTARARDASVTFERCSALAAGDAGTCGVAGGMPRSDGFPLSTEPTVDVRWVRRGSLDGTYASSRRNRTDTPSGLMRVYRGCDELATRHGTREG